MFNFLVCFTRNMLSLRPSRDRTSSGYSLLRSTSGLSRLLHIAHRLLRNTDRNTSNHNPTPEHPPLLRQSRTSVNLLEDHRHSLLQREQIWHPCFKSRGKVRRSPSCCLLCTYCSPRSCPCCCHRPSDRRCLFCGPGCCSRKLL